MALTINTNISSLIAQRNFDSATAALNLSIERMTTGYKINHASDNAAGYSISNMWKTQLGSLDIAADNAATGSDMLTTAEETYGLLTGHLQRVRDLTEQAANGTYGSTSLRAIQAEILARLQEVDRISMNSEFNGIKLMAYTGAGDGSGIREDGLNLQVGLYADEYSTINLDSSLFADASINGIFADMEDQEGSANSLSDLLNKAGLTTIANLGSETADDKLDALQSFAAACCDLILADYDEGSETATEEYVEDFSGFVAFVGTAAAKKAASLKEKDRIKLGDVEVTTKYNKEKERLYTNFKCYNFETQNNENTTYSAPSEPQPLVDEGIDEDKLPF